MSSRARANAIAWLRRVHGWVGLWGAALGLLFGLSGIWLNHRAVLPLQAAAERSLVRLALDAPPPATASALAAWLQAALRLPGADARVRIEKSRPVAWAEGPASAASMQPEHWIVNLATPKSQLQADYWVGNRTVGVRRTDGGLVAILANLHKGVGMPVAWILLVDTLAGGMILLSLSGVGLWMLTRRRRTAGLAILAAAVAAAAGLALARL